MFLEGLLIGFIVFFFSLKCGLKEFVLVAYMSYK